MISHANPGERPLDRRADIPRPGLPAAGGRLYAVKSTKKQYVVRDGILPFPWSFWCGNHPAVEVDPGGEEYGSAEQYTPSGWEIWQNPGWGTAGRRFPVSIITDQFSPG